MFGLRVGVFTCRNGLSCSHLPTKRELPPRHIKQYDEARALLSHALQKVHNEADVPEVRVDWQGGEHAGLVGSVLSWVAKRVRAGLRTPACRIPRDSSSTTGSTISVEQAWGRRGKLSRKVAQLCLLAS